MAWAKLDDNFVHNEKIEAVSNEALGAWIRILGYCANQKTDGFISKAKALQFAAGNQSVLDELVNVRVPKKKAGLLEVDPDGYRVHDFLEYNPSKAKQDQEQEERQERSKLAGKKSGEVRAAKAAANQLVEQPVKEVVQPKRIDVSGKHPLEAEHRRLFNRYPSANKSAGALKKWLELARDQIPDQATVNQVDIAIDAYTEQLQQEAKSYERSWNEHQKFVKAPSNFLADGFWRTCLQVEQHTPNKQTNGTIDFSE